MDRIAEILASVARGVNGEESDEEGEYGMVAWQTARARDLATRIAVAPETVPAEVAADVRKLKEAIEAFPASVKLTPEFRRLDEAQGPQHDSLVMCGYSQAWRDAAALPRKDLLALLETLSLREALTAD